MSICKQKEKVNQLVEGVEEKKGGDGCSGRVVGILELMKL